MRGNDGLLTADGGHLLLGTYYPDPKKRKSVFRLIKADASGKEQWERLYGGYGLNIPAKLLKSPYGGYILVGTKISQGAGQEGILVIKVDKGGKQEWEKTFGGEKEDRANSAMIDKNESFVILRTTGSKGAGKGDIWALKLAEPDY